MCAAFADTQTEIYRAGQKGRRPEHPISPAALEERAREVLDPVVWNFLAGGAGIEDTMRANRDAFQRWRIVPRMLRDVACRDLSIRVFDTEMPAPVMVAPIGVQSLFCPDGELAVARAAAAVGVPMVVSTVSSRTLEEVAEAGGAAPRWFQLYWPDDADLTASLVDRAAAAGYQAVVVTVDNTLLGWRPRELAAAYLPYLHGVGLANYVSDPVFRAALPRSPEEDPHGALMHFTKVFSRQSLTWNDLERLRELTSLPIMLKGILSPDDAELAHAHGVDAVCVSNHGGRQIDGEVASLNVLADIVDRSGDMPVLFDSGIRSGADCFKALALGATAVLVGRPVMWGLAVAGQSGVTGVLHSLLAELDLTAGLAGCAGIADVGRELLTQS